MDSWWRLPTDWAVGLREEWDYADGWWDRASVVAATPIMLAMWLCWTPAMLLLALIGLPFTLVEALTQRLRR